MNTLAEITDSEGLRASGTFAGLVRWGLYPSIWLWTLICIGYAISHPESMQEVQMTKGGVMVVVLLLCEWAVPYQKRWGMTPTLPVHRIAPTPAHNFPGAKCRRRPHQSSRNICQRRARIRQYGSAFGRWNSANHRCAWFVHRRWCIHPGP